VQTRYQTGRADKGGVCDFLSAWAIYNMAELRVVSVWLGTRRRADIFLVPQKI